MILNPCLSFEILPRNRFVQLLLFVWLTLMSVGASAQSDEEVLWDAIKQGGHTILMRHALAPGNGDPSHFDVADCKTQRNLSEQGRQQAQLTGQRFRDHGIDELVVYSSQWCRCMDTASMLDLGSVIPNPALNSFFADRSQRDEKTQAALGLIEDHTENNKGIAPTLLFVTHQVNISALTDVFPKSGEMIIVKWDDGEVVVVGRIE